MKLLEFTKKIKKRNHSSKRVFLSLILANKSGHQMKAIKAMVDRITSGGLVDGGNGTISCKKKGKRKGKKAKKSNWKCLGEL